MACVILIATPASTQTPAPAPTAYGSPIEVGVAQAIIRRGIELGTKQGHKLSFAVVEPSGELVAFARMDGTTYASIRLAQNKARTAARLRITTAELERRVLSGRTVLLSSDEVLAIAGGVPISVEGKIIGALGVSGATAAEDDAIATAAAAAP
jgi:uncharacterized protein GlcG (DUF336 family)